MNKIKLMYDIAKTMKEKELFNGSLQVECVKDLSTVFQMNNEFSKDLSTGLTKANIKTKLDYEGKSFKHESSTEFTHPWNSHPHGHRNKGKHPHFYHFRHCGNGQCGHGHSGLKGIFSGLTFAFDLLNRTEITEQPDNTILMTLEMDQLPKELQKMLTHKFKEEYGEEQEQEGTYRTHHHGHSLMKELHALENPSLKLISRINKNNEIESIDVTLSGKQIDDQQEIHVLNLNAKITFLYN
ncbi:MAG: hypothetical protein APF84_08510 [Gracilibacter sp. BRH_c7a]|nr:MAG: hypothetical protein APF84_08510 [Gracilibacter sp. BRH_c7a]